MTFRPLMRIDFPYVRLKMKNADLQHYTPYQLRYWMLTYTPVPEGAIAPNIYFECKRFSTG